MTATAAPLLLQGNKRNISCVQNTPSLTRLRYGKWFYMYACSPIGSDLKPIVHR